MEQQKDFFGEVLKIALGVALAGLLIWGVRVAFINYQLRQLNAVVQESMNNIQLQAEQSQARLREQQRQRAETKAAHLRAQAEAERELALRQIAVQEAERRKEAAWQTFFQPSQKCLNEFSVDCGNAHMKARREFERQYAGE